MAIELSYPDHILADARQRFDDYDLLFTPTEEQLHDLVKLAYFASLLREEGAPVKVALAFLSREYLAPGRQGDLVLSPAVFDEPRPARIDEIAKLAPALDHRQSAIVIGPVNGELKIVGIIRTSLDRYRSERSELRPYSFGDFAGIPYVRVTAEDAGVLSVGVHMDVVAVFARGKRPPAPIRVLSQAGVVRDTFSANAKEMDRPHHAAINLYCQTVLRILRTLSKKPTAARLRSFPICSAFLHPSTDVVQRISSVPSSTACARQSLAGPFTIADRLPFTCRLRHRT